MTPLLFVVLGSYMVFLALTDQLSAVIGTIASQPTNGKTPKVFNYLVGGFVVSIPVMLLESQGNTRAAWNYTALIVVSLLVFYYKPFTQSVNQISSMIQER